MSLPRDVIFYIADFLSIVDIHHWSSTSKHMCQVLSNHTSLMHIRQWMKLWTCFSRFGMVLRLAVKCDDVKIVQWIIEKKIVSNQDVRNVCIIAKEKTKAYLEKMFCVIGQFVIEKLNIDNKSHNILVFGSNEKCRSAVVDHVVGLNSHVYMCDNEKALKHVVKSRKEEIRGNGLNCDPLFLIFNDADAIKRLEYSEPLKELMFNGRHLIMGAVFSTQTVLDANPQFRTNMDYIFIGEISDSDKWYVWGFYGGIFATFELFCQFLDKFTKEGEFLVINKSSTNFALESVIAWYK